MDKTSKAILNMFKTDPDKIVFYSQSPYKTLGLSEEEFYRGVRYLCDLGLIEYVSNQDDIHLGIRSTHSYVHRKRIRFDSFLDWFFHTYTGGVITGVTTTVLAELILYFLLH